MAGFRLEDVGRRLRRVANLDPGECGVKTGGPWGCTFDASRNPDSCGPAKIDDKNDSLNVTAEKSSPGRKS
jgi:hypothetical protein